MSSPDMDADALVSDGPERPSTASASSSINLLTDELVMRVAGDYDLLSMKELILRDEGLEGLSLSCAESLASLEILSLSHNRLVSLTHFQHLVNLVELNLNFNRIESLENLQCPGLEKLFVANNNIASIAPLRRLLRLNTVSLYGNQVSDLEASLHTCRGLPQLRSLDLGGNPCSRELEGYKFKVIRVLPRLRTLDGDQITPLDKDLAEEFAVRQGGRNQDEGSGGRRGVNRDLMNGVRPMTAPVQIGSRRMLPLGEASGSPSFDPFASEAMPRGNVRLFRDDYLNNHPILLEYLATGVQETAPLDADGAVQTARTKFTDEDVEVGHVGSPTRTREAGDGPSGRSFVDKMRTANPLSRDDNDQDLGRGEETLPVRPPTANSEQRPTTAALSSSLGIDPSDPKATVRKLLKHIEVLMETIANYKNRQLESHHETLMAENSRLRIENNNIPVLRDEVEDLKKRLAAFESGTSNASTSATATQAKRVAALESENSSLKREIARVKQLLKQQMSVGRVSSVVESPEGLADSSSLHCNGSADSNRLGNSTLFDDSAAVDVELTELILQNEVSLELIRNDIKHTKLEWEERFERAKELERDRIRPSTSLGLAPTRLAGSNTKPSENSPHATARQLHTSAGSRAGPAEHLLRATTPASVHPVKSDGSRNGRPASSSATNILTL